MSLLKAKKSFLYMLVATSAFYSASCSSKTASGPTDPSDPDPIQEPSSVCQEARLVEQPGSNVYGVIEIGSSGVKAEVIQKLPSEETEGGFDLTPREEDIEPKDVDPIEPETQAATVAAVSDTFLEMQERFGIPCEHIAIYGSSGFASKAPHSEVLIDELETEIGRDIELISEEAEAIYVFNAVVPPHRLDEVVMLDIGSGNIKAAYVDNADANAPRKTFAVDFGTKSFTTAVNEEKGTQDFETAAVAAKEAKLRPEIESALASNPEVADKSRVYLAGGISWALTTLSRPCAADQQIIEVDGELASEFSPLSAEDINTFYINVTRDPDTLFSPNLSACKEERAEKTRDDVELIRDKVFEVEQLVGGAEILRALSDTMDFGTKEAIFFSSYAFEALPLGYLKQQIDASASTEN